MKKTLLAVALLTGFAGAAHAADSVTLYGLIDAGIGYEQVKFNGNSQSRLGGVQGVSSGSRFGLRGTEDLGDGLRAVFNLEGGFGPMNGQSLQSGRLWGRQATVGLDSDSWGRLEFGRQTNLASKYFGSIDPFSTSYNTANLGTTFSSANTMRLDNMVLYQTPSMDGFKVGVGYSFSADDSVTDDKQKGFATGNNNRVLTAGVQYVNGPLNLAAAYDRFNPSNDTTGGKSSSRIQEYIIGGTYDFEVVKVAAAFSQTRDGWFIGQNMGTTPDGMQKLGTFKLADGFRANSYMIGATVPLGRHAVFGSWQRATPNNDKLTGDDATFNVYSLGYTYDFTKRTNLYAYASYGDNYAFQRDARDTAFAVGVRHRF
ncbi:porin [Achromobacter pulmonis]|uniref:Outer membrane porin protein n=1 Tax=Achromobacter pulmonis TaxID=1389932 RepID=A0A6S7DB69_9BURK|nr:porin [Achromobacter pulmonis]MCF7768037.1 porin [Achromobacter pulmonis]CAB3638889.1 Outer membrane porin protein [Achromobacter pulmonis]CAB3886136.1 Outer membrane porin protein [Achromobacter pulmonis]